MAEPFPTIDPTLTATDPAAARAARVAAIQAKATAAGFGAAPTVAAAATPAPTAAASIWSALTKPISATQALVGAGRGALAVGRSLLSPASLIPTGAGVLASKMAGGDAAAGLDPSMLARGVAEGYARFAPQALGGLSPSEVAAADSQGASDIENRFGAVPAPAQSAAAPVPAPAAAPAAPLMPPAPAINPATAAAPAAPAAPTLTAADITGTGMPASGTGGFVNTRTGAVTNLGSPDAAAPATAGPAYALGSEGAYIGAILHQRQAAQTIARQMEGAKIGAEYAKNRAQAVTEAKAQSLADAVLNAKTPTEAQRAREAAAALGKQRVVGSPGNYTFIPTLGADNKVIAADKTTGATSLVAPTAPVKYASQSDFDTNVKNYPGKTPAQILAAIERQGYDVSRIKTGPGAVPKADPRVGTPFVMPPNAIMN